MEKEEKIQNFHCIRKSYKMQCVFSPVKGFRKVKVDGELYDIDKAPDLNKKLKHDIYILVDRIIINLKYNQEVNGKPQHSS